MRNRRDQKVEADYAAFLRGMGCTTGPAREPAAARKVSFGALSAHDAGERAESTHYFVFSQDGERWHWQCFNRERELTGASRTSFEDYLLCTSDARVHGWKGSPVSLFLPAGLL